MPDPIELRIEKLVYGGDGLGHHEGHTVFAPFVLPEEIVSIEPLERRKKFIRGRVVKIISPSPKRTTPPCPYFGVCGGCDYQHIPYEVQLQYKSEILRETLSRLGRISWEGPIVSHASAPFEYRNRAQWKIGPRNGGELGIGYFEAGSQRLCAVNQCPISSPRIQEILGGLARLLAAGKLPAALREVEAFVDHTDTKALLNLEIDRFEGSPDKIAETLRGGVPGIESMLFHDRRSDRFELIGPGHISYRVGDHNYQVGHLSFFQVNRSLLEDLVRTVVGDLQGALALDLFAGVGLFTVPLAHRFQRVIGVESNLAAVRDLEVNLQQSGAASPAARQAEVETFFTRWREKPDLIVLDPPRAGIPAQVLEIGRASCRERV